VVADTATINAIESDLTTASGDATSILEAVTTAVEAADGLDASLLGAVDESSITASSAPLSLVALDTTTPPPQQGTEDDGARIKSGLSWVGMALVASSFAV